MYSAGHLTAGSMDISVALGPAWAFMPDGVLYAIDLISERDFSASSASTVSGSPMTAISAPSFFNAAGVAEQCGPTTTLTAFMSWNARKRSMGTLSSGCGHLQKR